MRACFIIIIALVIALGCVTGCDSKTAAIPPAAKAGEKLVAHGYRKYTQQQFAAANKAYLEAYFVYVDAGIEPTPKLYSGLSALTIRSIENSPDYPLTTQSFVVGQQEVVTIKNDQDLIDLSARYLQAALALSDESSSQSVSLNTLYQCHKQRLVNSTVDCRLINEKLFSYPLD